MKKVFVLDTNVLISDPFAFKRMGEHDVDIPLPVIEELDGLKGRGDSVAASARQVAANLDPYLGPDLYNGGVSLGPGKGKLSISIVKGLHPEVKKMFKKDIPDNWIISAAMSLKDKISREENKTRKKKVASTSVIFVSNDTDLRFKAGALGLDVEKYRNNAIDNVDSLYSGIQTIKLDDELVSLMFSDGKVSYGKVRKSLGDSAPEPHPYEFFEIPSTDNKTFSYFYGGNLYPITNGNKVYGSVSARNDEQRLAMNHLLNPDIELMTLSGPAGTGKTLLAMGAAIQLLTKYDTIYEKILITKPAIALSGRDPGALPGDKFEKVMPYMMSLYDNIDFLTQSCKSEEKTRIERLVSDRKKFSIEVLDYIRGRTYANTILIVDEAQNLTQLDMKSLVTRMGDNSKLICTGDIWQIDHKYLDSTNNGLTHLIENAKNYAKAGHIDLIKGERSALAEWAAKNL